MINKNNPVVAARKYRSFALLAAAIVAKPLARNGAAMSKAFSDAIDALVLSDRRLRRTTG
ncbi:hypothetical protein [Nibricoccus aquaticus]|uniref:hypothetical protein n=1 Tax=Nibricoccus aquaticus TaxID=2576891 RepID=UPI0010FE62ED|nr:hypothetical protein [Nibricoccus aquaticus]